MIHQRNALVLDRDPQASRQIADQLDEEGINAKVCSDVETLRSALRLSAPDICLIGRRLDGHDGLQLVRDLRQGYPSAFIIIGDTYEELDVVLALEMGADDFVAKPLRVREVAARVRAVIRRTFDSRTASLGGARVLPDDFLNKVGDVEICGIQRAISVSGREIPLSTREFDVLMVFMSRRNIVLSREEIITLLPGAPCAYNDRLIDGVVSRLRRKVFDKSAGNLNIKTVHNRGYMLTADF